MGDGPQMAAQGRLVVDKGDPETRPSGLGSCRESGRTTADDGYVCILVDVLVVASGRVVHVELAQAGKAPNPRRDHAPQESRADEHLVVEAHRQKLVQPVENREQVEFQRRPCILVTHRRPFAQRFHAGADAGHAVHVHQAVGATAGHANQAAGAVVLEAASEGANARCVQG